MVRIGTVELSGTGCSLSRNRAKAKRTLKSIAKMVGVKNVYFVRTKSAPYGGYYRSRDESIVVVEQHGARKVPMYLVTFRFFHELTHHLHREGKIFSAYYCNEARINGRRKRYTLKDRRRVALRAERHAHKKACELAQEFFNLHMVVAEYPKAYLREARGDIFE